MEIPLLHHPSHHGWQVLCYEKCKTEAGYTEWQGNSPLARMAIVLSIVLNAFYIGLHARGELHCDSHPECSIASIDLSLFFLLRKYCHSVVNSSLYSSLVPSLFLALHRMLPWQIYRTEMDKQNLDMPWICFQIRTMLSGESTKKMAHGDHQIIAAPPPP
ncbi:hypothetical protein ACP70R_044299 [Stipagrostis hirtigluma subsp. patula]